MGDRLVLEIELPGYNVEDVSLWMQDDAIDLTLHEIVTEEWMRDDVILVATDIPADKSGDRPEMHALEGRIVGARIASDPSNQDTRGSV